MRIVVNTRLLRKNQMDGIGWFTYHSLKHMVEEHPHVQFHFLFDSGIQEEFLFGKNVIAHNLFPPARHAILNIAWFEWSVKRVLKNINPDLFFSPDGSLCLGWTGKQLGVIHDLSFLHRPADLKWTNRTYYNYFFPRFARHAERIATISEYSKSDISRSFNIDPAKIDVVYGAGNELLHPIGEQEQLNIKTAFTAGKDYFIFIGTVHPRKNIIRLLNAFELFKEDTGADLKMVIAGKLAYKSEEVLTAREKMKYKDDVIFTGRVDDAELGGLLGAAFACTFVPYFEGFGMPIIEAMQCNVPVICSNTTSMPEIAGDAALLVNPENTEEIRQAMTRLFNEPSLRKRLIEKGRERKKLFTFRHTATQLWKSIERCMNNEEQRRGSTAH